MGQKITLRAFKVENDAIDKTSSDLLPLLVSKLNGSIVNQRRMILNQEDPNKEEDLIADYTVNSENHVSGVVLRICPTEDIPNIPDTYLDNEKISLSDLDNLNSGSAIAYKEHYYFILDNNILVTTLAGNKTITRLQTYINWLLAQVRGNKLFIFTPKVIVPPQIKLSELKNMVVKDSLLPKDINSNSTETSFGKKLISIPDEILSFLTNDVSSLQKIKDSKILSASLLIKFSKPKEMTKEDFERTLGTTLKPISESGDIIFNTKAGTFRGSEILKTKKIDVDLTESGKISEQHLLQEMEVFLRELQNENSN